MEYQDLLESVCRQVLPLAGVGRVADYIPALANVDPDRFGICLRTVEGNEYAVGDSTVRFSIQSMLSAVFNIRR